MHALPFLLSLASAAILAPAMLRALSAGGHTRLNYRSRPLPCPFGVLTLAAALLALIPLTLLGKLTSAEVFHPEVLPIAVYALGVIALGLVDDTLAESRSVQADQERAERPVQRGWRGLGAAGRTG